MEYDNVAYHNNKELENMMLNIINEGDHTVWNEIERVNNPLRRCKQRKIYAIAMNKINNSNK